MPTKWNPNDKHSEITLTNNNLTATLPASSRTVRSTISMTTGKLYFECWNVWFGGSRMIGVALTTANLGSFLGGDANGFGIYYSAGWRTVTNNVFTNEGGTAPPTGIATAVGICVDLDNNLIYATHNGVNIVGDPTALTGGKAIPVGTRFAATGGSVGKMTVNFGAIGFAFAPPAPFSAWDTSPFTYKPFDTSTVSITSVSQPVGS